MTDFADLRNLMVTSDSRDEAAHRISERFDVTVDQAMDLLTTRDSAILPFLFPKMLGRNGILSHL